MSSYFANSYMPDMRNGGVVSAEHPHQHQHYGAAVQVPQGGQSDPNSCGDPSGLRQGIPPHHYGGPPSGGQPPQGMPYPRFPPYDRMDIRAAGYYSAQQQQMDGNQGYRPDSPSGMHMANSSAPNQTPVVYASCKLQAAAVTQNGVLGPASSPPLDTTQPMNHHMGHHMQEQHQQHHQQHHQQQHMMYGGQQAANMHQQGPPHQQAPIQQQPAQSQQPPGNTASALPSPLYPWMRSQFGEFLKADNAPSCQ
ncbi:hypothetical protein BDFB_011208, partial [Asbolus verrucosus]